MHPNWSRRRPSGRGDGETAHPFYETRGSGTLFFPDKRIPDRLGPGPLTERFRNIEETALDRGDIAALSSDVRVAILKALDSRPMTTSELADGLGLGRSTVREHLAVLTDADLVTHGNGEVTP
jgi:hypothetical protein